MTGEETALELLIGGYLNEDVFDFYQDVMAGVDDFCRREPDLVNPLAAEIARLLRAMPTEGETARYLHEQGVGFVAGELGYRSWLRQIADHVRAVAAG